MGLIKTLSLLFGISAAFSGLFASSSLKTFDVSNSQPQTHEIFNNAQMANHGVLNEGLNQKPSAEEIQSDLNDNVKLEVTRITYSNIGVNLTVSLSANDSYELYSIGYYGSAEEGQYFPARMSVIVEDEEGNALPEEYSADIKKPSNGVVSYLSVDYTDKYTLECSIEIPAKTTVKEGSIKLTNLLWGYETKEESSDGNIVFTPHTDFSETFYKEAKNARKVHTTNFNEFLDIKPIGITKFDGYFAVQLEVDNKLDIETYCDYIARFNSIFLKPDIGPDGAEYIQNKIDLLNGSTFININFNLTKGESKFIIVDSNGNEQIVDAFPCEKSLTYGKNNVVLFVPSSSVVDIKDFVIYRPMLYVNVIKASTRKEVGSSSFYFRFGLVSTQLNDIADSKGNVVYPGYDISRMNYDLVVTLLFVIGTVVFFGTSVSYYFYKKNKYKDDEFKRVNKSSFIKTSIYSYIFLMSGLLDMFFLIARTNAYNNAEDFANPMDILVIVFTLITFLMGCYFIRRFYISTKETIEKNRRERLNLNSAQEDASGTIAISHNEKTDNEKSNKKGK